MVSMNGLKEKTLKEPRKAMMIKTTSRISSLGGKSFKLSSFSLSGRALKASGSVRINFQTFQLENNRMAMRIIIIDAPSIMLKKNKGRSRTMPIRQALRMRFSVLGFILRHRPHYLPIGSAC